jgi:hypothetical protein
MKNLIKKNWFPLLIFVIIVASIILHFVSIELIVRFEGFYAYLALFIIIPLSILLLYIGIFGGDITINSNGFMGIIKDIKNRNKINS